MPYILFSPLTLGLDDVHTPSYLSIENLTAGSDASVDRFDMTRRTVGDGEYITHTDLEHLTYAYIGRPAQ